MLPKADAEAEKAQHNIDLQQLQVAAEAALAAEKANEDEERRHHEAEVAAAASKVAAMAFPGS